MMAWFSAQAFERSGAAIKRASRSSEATFGPLVKRLTPIETNDNLDWAGDADWARLQQDPLRARGLLRVVAGALLVMLVWAAFVPIDEITRGEARVVPTTQVQIVQSVDGGVVEALLVKEGQIVEAHSGCGSDGENPPRQGKTRGRPRIRRARSQGEKRRAGCRGQ